MPSGGVVMSARAQGRPREFFAAYAAAEATGSRSRSAPAVPTIASCATSHSCAVRGLRSHCAHNLARCGRALVSQPSELPDRSGQALVLFRSRLRFTGG